MLPQDSQSIARRPLDVEDYIDVVRRHKSWILGPTFAAIVVATVVAFLWPDTYQSTGVIRVVPPQIPGTYFRNNLNGDLQGRLNSMIQGTLSKNALIEIINNYDLYKKERARIPMEDVVESMRSRDLHIGTVESYGQVSGSGKSDVASFKISFSYKNRNIAQKVCQDLMNRILIENTKETTDVTIKTTDFLKQDWQQAKQKLDDLEAKLSAFRSKNLGHLPEQQQANFNQLTALQTQLLNLNTSMSRVNQEKLVLQNQAQIYKDQLSQLKDPAPADAVVQQKNEKLAEKDREITYLESALASARERYKEQHPDVQTLVKQLAIVKKQREEIVKEEGSKKPDAPVIRPASAEFRQKQSDLAAMVKHIDGLMAAKDLEMQDYQKSEKQLQESIRTMQGRLQGAPTGLKDYEELMRDRDLAKKDYEEKDKKVSDSETATRVIKNHQGEQLDALEDASLPQTPTEPKRPLIILAGLGIGIVLGLFMAGAREIKDTSLKNLKDVRAYTQLPILGSIPLLENDLIVRRRRRLSWLAWATACLLGVVVMSSSVIYYYATKV